MNDEMFDEINLEKFIRAHFGLKIGIKSLVARKIPVGAGAISTVILSDKGLLFALIFSRGAQNLGDVKKILSRMNLKTEQFLPPAGNPNYFEKIAEKKFREVFPAREKVSEKDLIFYKTLAPYNPAFAQISEVKNGAIFQFDRDAASGWRPSVKFAYRRIRTS